MSDDLKPRSELIEGFRASERSGQEVAAAMLLDFNLAILVAHWRDVRVTAEDGPAELGGLADWWEALWDGSVIDYDQVSRMIDVDLDVAIRLVDRAVELRFVYPDGTTNEKVMLEARALVGAEIKRRVGVK